MKLTDKAIKAAAPKDKPYKLADGEGMYLEVMPNGSKYWRMKYRISGKEKRLAFGVFPDVSLKDARERRYQAKQLLEKGIDPSSSAPKKAETDSWLDIALEWHGNQKGGWSPRHAVRMTNSINEAAQTIGHLSVSTLTAPDIIPALRKAEARGAHETAKKIHQCIKMVCQYAVITGRAGYNPAIGLSAVLQAVPTENYPHLKETQLPDFLRALDQYHGGEVTRLATEFLMLTFVRPENVRFAEWPEFDEERKLWRIPPEKMKIARPHIVPLSKQALVILKRMREINGKKKHVFAEARRDTPMSNNTILFALYRLGYKGQATAHGFRHTASTILNEHGFSPDAIERQLAHIEGNKVRAAYNHAQYLIERTEMMQWYADYLDQRRAG